MVKTPSFLILVIVILVIVLAAGGFGFYFCAATHSGYSRERSPWGRWRFWFRLGCFICTTRPPLSLVLEQLQREKATVDPVA
jgi:hypothetical protein